MSNDAKPTSKLNEILCAYIYTVQQSNARLFSIHCDYVCQMEIMYTYAL